MKYLKTFETISNSIFNVDVFKRSFGITPDELEDFFVEMVDDLDLNAKVMWDRSINAAIIKIDVPVEGRPRLDEWFSENIKPKLGRIKTQLKNNFGLDYSGYQLGLSSETNFHYKLIWYKSSDLPSGKRNESFSGFQLDEISKQEYYTILYNRLVYIPESKVLEFKSKLSKEYKLGYGRASVKDTVEFFRAECETEVDYHITSKTFSIKKKSLGADEPCYIMSYHYEEFTSFEAPQSHIETLPNQERIFFEKKSYYRFEESDFNQMCKNPQILLDYLDKKNMIKESFEYHGQKYAEQICDEWGMIDLEDLENLFLEFGDEGQVLIHPMIVNKEIKVTVHKIWQELNDSDWLYNPLWDSRFESIKKQLNRLGLDLNVETKNLNQRFVSVRIFPMSDRKRTHSKTDIVKESFEIGMGAHNIVNDFGLVMDDIEELFLEFSDMGYRVRIMKRSLAVGEKPGLLFPKPGHDILIVDIIGIGDKSNDPDIRLLKEKIIRNSKFLGLDMVDTPKWVTQFMQKSDLRFKFNKL